MTTLTTLIIPGISQTKGSTRSFMAGGRIVTTSANPNLKSWEHAVRVTAIEAGLTPTTGRVDIQIEFVMPRPKGHYGKRGLLPRCVDMPHTKKPDLDKLVRAILDALTGVAYVDDAQVRCITAWKRYHNAYEHSGAIVNVTAL